METVSNNLIWASNEEELDAICERNIHIMEGLLREIGCQPQRGEDDEKYLLKAAYQGENFTFVCDRPYIRIYDLAWSSFNENDPNYFTFLQALNDQNHWDEAMIVVSDPDESGLRIIHSHTCCLFNPGFSGNARFLKETLNSFFTAKDILRDCFNKLMAKHESEMANTGGKRMNAVGFAIGTADGTDTQEDGASVEIAGPTGKARNKIGFTAGLSV